MQNHGVLADGRFLLPYPGFDIMPELDWDDVAAMDAAIDSPVHDQESLDDEANFIDVRKTGYAVTTRHVMRNGDPPDGAVKLITLLRRAPGATPSAFAQALLEPYAGAVRRSGCARHEILLTLPDRDGRPAFALQAVDMMWFAAPADALAWLESADAFEAAWHLAGIAFGSERLIARPLKVV